MKKANVILSLVLALVIMFNVGVVLYGKGYSNGVQAWSDHVESQKELKIRNEMKHVIENLVSFNDEEEL